jgi:hypothetical protein
MAQYLVVAEVVCTCSNVVTLRAVQGTYGGVHSEECWKCNAKLELKGNRAYANNFEITCRIISREIRKK